MLNNYAELVDFMKEFMGRPLIAHMTNEEDANIVTKWSMGKVAPNDEQMKQLYFLFNLIAYMRTRKLSNDNIRDWFTGNNPVLDGMPADFVKANKLQDVRMAFHSWVSETS